MISLATRSTSPEVHTLLKKITSITAFMVTKDFVDFLVVRVAPKGTNGIW